MSILIAHPRGGVFVNATVEALETAGLLQRYATSLGDDPGSRLQGLARRLHPRLRALLARRKLPGVARGRVAMAPGGEIVRSIVQRVTGDEVATDLAWDWATRRFDRWAASLIDAGTRAVYGYEHASLQLFEAAAARGIPRILELPSAEPDEMRALAAREASSCGIPYSRYERHVARVHGGRLARLRREFELATRVIVNSSRTLDSYRSAGLRTDHFVIVPLGGPEPLRMAGPAPTGAARLLWAGSFSLPKGARVLVEALRGGRIEGLAPIEAYGSVSVPAALREEAARHMRFRGAVEPARLFAAMRSADALLLPSLSDGWGMVVSEALAHGLPVITTTAVGAACLVQDGYNGRLLPPGDAEALRAVLAWAGREPGALRAMRGAALASASRSWADYRRELALAVEAHIDGG
jgi:glycosyltransferase involved in cell wall biosynthesis